MKALLGVVLALVGCATPGRPVGQAPPLTEVTITGDPVALRTTLAQVLAGRGYTLTPSTEPSVLQAEGGTIVQGEVSLRISFVLTPTGAVGRAWWKHGAGPTTTALRAVGLPISDVYVAAEEHGKGFSDDAFVELSTIAAAVSSR